ncbi:MAG: nucleotidyltransferase [bacterium]
MSFDQSLLIELHEALAQAGLQVILIGNAAAIIQGAPLLTRDIDFLVRDHPQLQKKLRKFAQIYGVKLTRPYEPTSKMIRAVGRPVEVDFLVTLGSGKSFESVRSRAMEFKIGKRTVLVASLEDIIAAKEAAGRPKDKAALPILKESLRVKNGYEQEKRVPKKRKEK